jgi:hypothetical protein
MTLDRVLGTFAALVAIVQIWKWVSGRRGDRGLSRMGEEFASKKDLKAIRGDIRRLEKDKESLQVAVPALATKLHLEQRKSDLKDSLAKTWDEYNEVKRRLAENISVEGISPALLALLETEIEPRYRAQQRERRRTRFLLIIMAAALLLPAPLTPQSLLYLIGGAVAIVAAIPQTLGEFALAAGAILTAVGFTAGFFLTTSWLRRTMNLQVRQHLSRVSFIALALLLVVGNLWSGWLTLT